MDLCKFWLFFESFHHERLLEPIPVAFSIKFQVIFILNMQNLMRTTAALLLADLRMFFEQPLELKYTPLMPALINHISQLQNILQILFLRLKTPHIHPQPRKNTPLIQQRDNPPKERRKQLTIPEPHPPDDLPGQKSIHIPSQPKHKHISIESDSPFTDPNTVIIWHSDSQINHSQLCSRKNYDRLLDQNPLKVCSKVERIHTFFCRGSQD